jgi:hypothetical protein
MGQDTIAANKWLETVLIGVRELVTEIDKTGGRYLTVKPHLTPL